ncbi:MAG: tRNA (adenosine(37)-N6)-threonylcarbamoyltransferase complex ATPase subunit type 1 TsaE [Bacteroidales bacterium]|nr:tRNA (adenosine(37)-N6)-threonylcarbamoyltransferase complex ATPase subunit type 1 TsaE [Bacteroidales bacterium]
MVSIKITNLSEIRQTAREFLAVVKGKRIFAFYGAMGAGKTTFIKAICEELGSLDSVTSPTFTIVNEYITSDSDSLFHFDFYRIKTTEELFDFGFEEYISSGKYCFMVWPEKAEEALPPDTIVVKINVDPGSVRNIVIEI